MKFVFNKRKIKSFWVAMAANVFKIFLTTFLIVLVVEYAWPGFATNWFNPIWLLIIAVLSGIIMSVYDSRSSD